MHLADALSCFCICFDRFLDNDKTLANKVELFVRSEVNSTTYVDWRIGEILQAAADDQVYQQAVEFVYNRWPENDRNIYPTELAKLFVSRHRFTIIGGLMYFDGRIYIPRTMRREYLSLCHGGHQVVNKCRRRAQRQFWWPGLCSQIYRTMWLGCDTCIINSSTKHQPRVKSELSERPWETGGTDLFN